MSRPPASVRPQRARRRSELERQQSRDWKREVTRGGCEMCRAHPVDSAVRHDRALDLQTIQGHHIIEQKHLKRHGKQGHLWDIRNGMGLCAYHHQRHTNWTQRVPRELLPPAVYDFADEIGLPWLLDQYHPA
jgi:hypothetical protein